MANENPLPEEIQTKRREPAIRLKNPIARKAYHTILKEKWEEIKDMTFRDPRDRYI